MKKSLNKQIGIDINGKMDIIKIKMEVYNHVSESQCGKFQII